MTSDASSPSRTSGACARARNAARAATVAASSVGGNSATRVPGASGTPSNTAPSSSKSPPTRPNTSYAVLPVIAAAMAAKTG